MTLFAADVFLFRVLCIVHARQSTRDNGTPNTLIATRDDHLLIMSFLTGKMDRRFPFGA